MNININQRMQQLYNYIDQKAYEEGYDLPHNELMRVVRKMLPYYRMHGKVQFTYWKDTITGEVKVTKITFKYKESHRHERLRRSYQS